AGTCKVLSGGADRCRWKWHRLCGCRASEQDHLMVGACVMPAPSPTRRPTRCGGPTCWLALTGYLQLFLLGHDLPGLAAGMKSVLDPRRERFVALTKSPGNVSKSLRMSPYVNL